MNKKELVVKYRPLVSLACRIHNLRNFFRIKKTGAGNEIIAPCALLKKVNIRIKGSNNKIVIGAFAQLPVSPSMAAATPSLSATGVTWVVRTSSLRTMVAVSPLVITPNFWERPIWR